MQQVSGEIRLARTFWQRFRGLMLYREPPPWGLLFLRTSSIHMFWMRFPIDVLVLDRGGRILEVRENIRPWQVAFFRAPGAYACLEVAAGTGQSWKAYLEAHPEVLAPYFTGTTTSGHSVG